MNRLALLLLVPLLAVVGPVAPADAATPAAYATQAHVATNKQRAAAGMKELKQSACLQKLALKQARRMAAARVLGHQELGPVLSACGLRTAGENVADGFGSGRRVVDVGWMRSEGHRANILSGAFRMEGIGAARSRNGRWYVSQVFGTRL